MPIDHLRILCDFGLFLLIWIVQLVIYPSFLHYTKANLVDWHSKYTARISGIIAPLMIGQLYFAVFQFTKESTTYTIGSLVIIVILWMSTFLKFIPMHTKISINRFDDALLRQLVKQNWIRTVLWTGVFIWSFVYVFLD